MIVLYDKFLHDTHNRGEYAGTTNSFPLPVRSREIRNTHPGSPHQSWGLSCTDGDLLECSASKPCISLDPSSSPLRCVRGVCVKDDPRVCYMHSDCKSKDMLCTGNGRCSSGKIICFSFLQILVSDTKTNRNLASRE